MADDPQIPILVHTARHALGSVVLMALLAGCAGPVSPRGAGGEQGSGPADRPPASSKRLVAAAPSNPIAFHEKVARANVSGPYRGGIDLEWLLNSALTVIDDRGTLHGQLAEVAPSLENGLWKVFPDGRMETTWKIRPGAVWHDGTPFTSEDLVFTATVVRDREMGALRDAAYDLIEAVEAADPRSITVQWKSPLISANEMFGHQLAVPMPKHLLEGPYGEDKAKLYQLPYWLAEFVGTGPFALKAWVPGSHLMLQANEQYVLGRPKLDEIEVKIITDPSTLISNLLAGAVELTLGYGMALESALQLRDQWRDGRVVQASNGWVMAYGQFINPNPPVVADVRFRRALLHAIDRQEMVETLQAGLVSVAHVFLDPIEPDYREIESSIVRYDYDPRRAAQMVEGFGYARGADGFFRDAAGQRLGVEIRTAEGLDIQVKATFSVADYWQRLGVGVEPIVSVPNVQDREWSATNPSFRLHRAPNDYEQLKRLRIAQVPLPENRFVGRNNPRYINQEFNDLIEGFFVTLPRAERMAVLRQVVHHITDQLVEMGLFYNMLSVALNNRVQNVTSGAVMGSNQTWNAHLWDVK